MHLYTLHCIQHFSFQFTWNLNLLHNQWHIVNNLHNNITNVCQFYGTLNDYHALGVLVTFFTAWPEVKCRLLLEPALIVCGRGLFDVFAFSYKWWKNLCDLCH